MFQYEYVEAPPAANEAAVLTTSGFSAAIEEDNTESHLSLDSTDPTADLVALILCPDLRLYLPCF